MPDSDLKFSNASGLEFDLGGLVLSVSRQSRYPRW